jgi:hypothetical protein
MQFESALGRDDHILGAGSTSPSLRLAVLVAPKILSGGPRWSGEGTTRISTAGGSEFALPAPHEGHQSNMGSSDEVARLWLIMHSSTYAGELDSMATASARLPGRSLQADTFHDLPFGHDCRHVRSM